MNSSNRLAAARYAAAYNALSSTNEEAATRAMQLKTAQQALSSVQEIMTNPRVPRAAKKQAVLAALGEAAQTASFVCLLLDAKRYTLLDEITRQVHRLLDKRLGIIRAQVCTAQPLPVKLQQLSQQALSVRYGGTVQAEFFTEPSLLGGMKIRCCGELIDGSLQEQLVKLEKELLK